MSKEDFNGAIEALERRAAHLASLVYPEPGNRPTRTAHWRDEVELKALRLGIKALKSERSRNDGTSEKRDEQLLEGLTKATELLESICNDGRLSPTNLANARMLVHQLDALIDDAD